MAVEFDAFLECGIPTMIRISLRSGRSVTASASTWESECLTGS
jgi:hypothetical protein